MRPCARWPRWSRSTTTPCSWTCACPRMDGDEATREIRALDRPDAATLPIIAETADAFEEGQRRARDAGMTALTTKPLNIHELMALLAEHIPEK